MIIHILVHLLKGGLLSINNIAITLNLINFRKIIGEKFIELKNP